VTDQIQSNSNTTNDQMDLLNHWVVSNCDKHSRLINEVHGSVFSFATEHTKMVKLIEQDNTTSCSGISNSLNDIDRSVQNTTTVWVEELGGSSIKSNDFVDSYSRALDEVKDRFQTFDLKAYNPTSFTPAKRTVEYPQQLTRTRPELEILAEFRNVPTVPTDPLASVNEECLDDNLEENDSFVDSPNSDLTTPQQTSPKSKTKSTQSKLNQNSRGKFRKPVSKPLSSERRGDGSRENSGSSKRTCTKVGRTTMETEPLKGTNTGREAQRTRLGDLTNQVVVKT